MELLKSIKRSSAFCLLSEKVNNPRGCEKRPAEWVKQL